MKTNENKTAKKTLVENRQELALERSTEDREKSLQALELAKEMENNLKAKGHRYMTKKGINYKCLVSPENFNKKIKDGWYFEV